MIDPRRLPERGGVSAVEDALARVLAEGRVSRVFVVEGYRPHGPGAAAAEPPDEAAGLDRDLSPDLASFAWLLEGGAEHLAAARAAWRESCRLAAVQARELAAFAAARPAVLLDRPDQEVGAAAAASRAGRPAALTAVSEWAVDEVMVALSLSAAAAAQLLAESVTLVECLPGCLAALEQAVIGPRHARMLVEVLGPVRAEVRGEVEARLLAGAAGKTVPQLRAAAQRAVLRADAAAAARRAAAAIRDRSVRVFPGGDGMGSLAATLPTPVLLACRDALRRYAQDCAVPGDQRTLDQRMVDCLVDLILRPGETGLPPVQAQLTVVAAVNTLTGGDEPGEVDGQPVPAVMVRQLAHPLGLLPRADDTPATNPVEAATGAPRTTHTEAGAEAGAGAEVGTPAEGQADEGRPGLARPQIDAPRSIPGRRPRRGWRSCSTCPPPPAPPSPSRPGSRSSRSSPASCSLSPAPPASGPPPPAPGPPAAPTAEPAPIRRPGPASARHRPPAATAPRHPWPGSSAPATGAAASPAAAPPPSAATSTTAPVAGRTHQRRQPLLPVPPPPPPLPPGTRLAHAPAPRRRPGMDHPRRGPAHHPPTRPRHRRPPTTATTATTGATTTHPPRTRAGPTRPTRRRTRTLLNGYCPPLPIAPNPPAGP